MEELSAKGHKKDLSKWYSLERSLDIMKMSFLPKLIYKFKTISISVLTRYFGTSQVIIKFICKNKHAKIAR